METLPALRQEVWEWIPPEAQAYIRALEAGVETLTSMVHALQEQVGTLQEQLHQTTRNSYVYRPSVAAVPSFRRHRLRNVMACSHAYMNQSHRTPASSL